MNTNWKWKRKKKIVLTFLTVLTLLVSRQLIHADAGDLDVNFDVDGKVITDFGTSNDLGRGIALQPDGRMIVAGKTFRSASKNDFAVARYNTDGSLDSNFGNGGKVITDFVNENDEAYDVAVQSDGKIIVAGISSSGASTYDFALVRYLPDGSLDSNFGSGGKVTADFAGDNDEARALVIQSDGKIVAVGRSLSGATGSDFALLRYNPDGSIDTNFGFGGKIVLDYSGGDDEEANAVALQQDQKIIVVGRTFFATDADFLIARYNPDGSLDDSFSSDGTTRTDFAGVEDDANGVTVQSDGKILVVGGSDSSGIYDFALARYNGDGSLDTTFSFDGKVTTDFSGGFDHATSVNLQFDGKIIVAGAGTLSGSSAFALARYNSQGSLDGSFNGDGKVIADFGGTDAAMDVAVQPNGKILAAGYNINGQGSGDFALVCFEGDSPPPCQFCDDFEDGIVAANWTYVKPQWSESNGNLIGTPSTKKAEAIASPAYPGCSNCTVQARMSTTGGSFSKVWLLAWYIDKNNTVELLMREDTDKWVLKHRSGGSVVLKMTGSSTILPNVFYDVQISFDGTEFKLIVNGVTLATKSASSTPNGTVGFRVKGATANIASINVN